jgi:hypothetical protein
LLRCTSAFLGVGWTISSLFPSVAVKLCMGFWVEKTRATTM